MIVFVSYSSKNRKRIEDLVLQLGQLGHDVQFESKVVGGEVLWQQIFESIAASDLFIATLSAETMVSYTSRIESEYARDLNKYILFVALDELSTLAGLDPQSLANIVDFSITNPNADQSLASALSSFDHLEPRASITLPPPSWERALEDLSRRVSSKSNDAVEQKAILLNLHEFLERHDTFTATRSLLATFAARTDLSPEIRNRARRLLSQANHIGSLLQKIQRRGIFFIAIIASLLVSLAVVLLSQAVLQFRAQRSSTLRLTSTALTLRPVTITSTSVQAQIADATTFTPLATTISPTQVTPSPEVTSIETVEVASDALDTITPSPIVTATLLPSTVAPKATSTSIPLITNTPRQAAKLSATTTPLPPTFTPTITSTVTPSATSTSLPTQVAQVPTILPPTAVPQENLVLAPAKGLAYDFEALLSRKLYVGLGVEDSVFGVRVNRVGGTAKTAGVQIGDYILAVSNELVRTSLDFLRVMQAQNPSSNLTLRLRRDNGIVNVSLVVGERDFALPYPR